MSFIIENNILKSTETYIDSKHNLGQLLFDALNESPHHVSQIDAESGKQTTCEEMKNCSIKCALWMKKQGIGPDDIVVVCAENQAETYVPALSTFFLDAVFSAWNSNISLHTAQRFLKQFTPKIIFTSIKAAEIILEASNLENSSAKLVVFENFSNLQSLNDIFIECHKKDIMNDFKPINKKSLEELAAIMLSSGSTGFPKGVMIPGKAFFSRLVQPIFPSVKDNLKFMHYITLSWISGIFFMLQIIISKYTRIIPTFCSIDNCFETIEKYKIDYVAMPPVFVNTLAKSERLMDEYDLQSLKFIYISGCKISKHNLDALKKKFSDAIITQIYGMTEALRLFQSNDKTKHLESIGSISSYCQAKFVDLVTEKLVGPNQHGEIRVKGPSIMIGYYKNMEATRESFDNDGWFCTGDIGYYNTTGEAFIVGRVKEIIKYKCNQISPAEIEEVLLSHSQVQDAAVLGIEHEIDGDWPIAFVVKVPESQVTEEELIEYTSVLEDYKKLRGGIYFLDSLPQTGPGKVAKAELKLLAEKLVKINDKQFL